MQILFSLPFHSFIFKLTIHAVELNAHMVEHVLVETCSIT